MARVGRMGLAPHLGRQVVVEIGHRPAGHRGPIHHLLDVAHIRDGPRRCRPQPRDVGGLQRDGGEDVVAVLRDRQVVDVRRPVVRAHVLVLAAVRVRHVVDVHRLPRWVDDDVVAVLADDEDRPSARGRDGVDGLGHRVGAGIVRTVQGGDVLGMSGVVHVDDGYAVRRRGRRVHLRGDPTARTGDVRAVARPRHVGVAGGRAPAVIQGGVPDKRQPAVVALLGPPRVLVGLGDVALDPLLGQVVQPAQVVVAQDKLRVQRVAVPLGECLAADDEGREQPDHRCHGHDPTKRPHLHSSCVTRECLFLCRERGFLPVRAYLLPRPRNLSTFRRRSSVSNDSVSDAMAKSMVASTERSTCRFSTRLVASTA